MRVKRTSRRAPRIIGIDASLNSTGYAYRHNGEVVTGLIKSADKRGSARIWHNLVNLRRLLDEAQPKVIYLEGYAMQGKGRSFDIAEWGGVIKMEAWRRGIDVVTVTPSTLKLVATGSGAAKKPQMAQALEETMGLAITQDDKVDAAWLLFLGEAHLGMSVPKVLKDRILTRLQTSKPGISEQKGAAIKV